MATENKEQVLVAMEGDISNVEKLIKLAKGMRLQDPIRGNAPRLEAGRSGIGRDPRFSVS